MALFHLHTRAWIPNKFGNRVLELGYEANNMRIETGYDNGDLKEYEGEKRDYSWSVNLELPEHSDDEAKVIEEAIQAVEQTESDYFVNLVTHANHDHPSEYLYQKLYNRFGDSIEVEFIDQCGCGGYVTRVTR